MLAVVDEAMANAGPGRKGCKVSNSHRVKIAVYPRVNLAFKNVHKLFFFLLGVRPGASLSWRQSHQVYANLEETGCFADAPLIAGVFVGVRITMRRLRT